MGKKALEEIGKVLLVSFISILVSVTVTRRALLDGKLDKSEYYRDQEEKGKSLSEFKNDIKEDLTETKEMVKFLYENEIKKGNN